MQQNPLLMLIVGPLAAGALCLTLPDRLKIISKALALLVSAAVFAVALFVFTKKPLSYNIGSYPLLFADNLSGFIALAISLFGLLIVVYSLGFTDKDFGRYFGYTLMTLGASIGVAFANDMTVFLVFWGFLAVMLYLLTSLKGTTESAFAAKKAIIIIGGTDVLMLLGMCIVWQLSKSYTISGVHLKLSGAVEYSAYFLLAIAAFAKAGAVPFHSWLPDVAEFAPATVTAYLPASLDKLLGIYLLARISLDMFTMNAVTNFILALIGSVTIVFAVVIALVQHDIKRLMGYHAVSQVGYMVLGIGTGSVIGIAGGLFHMLNHAIYKSSLFLTAGAVEKQVGTTDMTKLGGLSKYMPVTFAVCLVASLSISGVPPFNGFVSKWMIYQGVIETVTAKNPFWAVWLVCALFGSALTIASFMKLLHAVFLGRPDRDFKDIKEAPPAMLVPMAILAGLCIIFGVFAANLPIPLLIAPSISGTIAYMGIWNPAVATALILIALLLGAFAYLLFKPAGFRTASVFIGGEDVNKLDRVAGTEFYDTLKDLRTLKIIYKKESAGSLDIYNIFLKGVSYFTGYLQRLHNGILPTYMVWCLLGMIGIFLVIFLGQ
ncbi:MAG: proton-conducting transporter membrane subunit [Candidatus Omnitrophota bacterium]